MSMIQKRLLVTDRVRRPPAEVFLGLTDASSASSPRGCRAMRVLVPLSGRRQRPQGLSFYSDATLAVRLRVREEAVVAARDELVVHDLVAYQAPLTQVLSLPRPRVERGGPAALRELLRTLADEDESAAGRRNA